MGAGPGVPHVGASCTLTTALDRPSDGNLRISSLPGAPPLHPWSPCLGLSQPLAQGRLQNPEQRAWPELLAWRAAEASMSRSRRA